MPSHLPMLNLNLATNNCLYQLSQYHIGWCPSSLSRQVISSHGIVYVGQMDPYLPQGRIQTTCTILVLWMDECHYSDIIMSVMASQITSLTIVYSTVRSGTDQRKHQSSTSLAFVQGIHWWQVNSLHKGPVTRKMFPFDDVIMCNVIQAKNGKDYLKTDGIQYVI